MNKVAKLIPILFVAAAVSVAGMFFFRHTKSQAHFALLKADLGPKAAYIADKSKLALAPKGAKPDIAFVQNQLSTPRTISKNAAREEFIKAQQKANQKALKKLNDPKLKTPLQINIFNVKNQPPKQPQTTKQTPPEPGQTTAADNTFSDNDLSPAKHSNTATQTQNQLPKSLPNPKIKQAAPGATFLPPAAPPANTDPEVASKTKPDDTLPPAPVDDNGLEPAPEFEIKPEGTSITLKTPFEVEAEKKKRQQEKADREQRAKAAKQPERQIIPSPDEGQTATPPEGFTLNSTTRNTTEFELGWKMQTLILNFFYLMFATIAALGLSRTIMREKTDKQGLLLFSLPTPAPVLLLKKIFTFLVPVVFGASFIAYWQSTQTVNVQTVAALFAFMLCAASLIGVCAPNLRANSMLMLGLTAVAAYTQLVPPVLFSSTPTAQISLLGIIGQASPLQAATALVIPTYTLCAVCMCAFAACAFNAEDFFSPRPAIETAIVSLGRRLNPFVLAVFAFAALPFVMLVVINTDIPLAGLITNFKPFQNVHTQVGVKSIGFFLTEIIRLAPLLGFWLAVPKRGFARLLALALFCGAVFAPVQYFCTLYASRFFPEILLGANMPELGVYLVRSLLFATVAAIFIKTIKPRGFLSPVVFNTLLFAVYYYLQLTAPTIWLANL